MDKTITIVVPINAKPEYREEVKQRLRNLASRTRQEKGNLFYIPHEADDDSGRFVVYERWADQTALDFHMNQDYLKSFLDDSDTFLLNPIAGTICREIAL